MTKNSDFQGSKNMHYIALNNCNIRDSNHGPKHKYVQGNFIVTDYNNYFLDSPLNFVGLA